MTLSETHWHQCTLQLNEKYTNYNAQIPITVQINSIQAHKT